MIEDASEDDLGPRVGNGAAAPFKEAAEGSDLMHYVYVWPLEVVTEPGI